MGEGFWHDHPLRTALQIVVTDCGRSGNPALHVPPLEYLLRLICLVGPQPREAVGLQLQPDRKRVALALVSLSTQAIDLLHHAEQILHMVPDLVRDHIGAAKITACT